MSGTGTDPTSAEGSHWVRWHRAYEDPVSPLSVRLRLVQEALRVSLDEAPEGPIRIVSVCAGQGRDVIDVVAGHRRAPEISALLVELDPDLVAYARDRATAAGLAEQVAVVQGDAADCHLYADVVPAQVVLVCGVFGNISAADIAGTIDVLPSFCAPGASVIWTRHRRPPDATPTVRADFTRAGFEEQSFEDPDGYVLAVGRHRLAGTPSRAFDPDRVLFAFIGDGALPA